VNIVKSLAEEMEIAIKECPENSDSLFMLVISKNNGEKYTRRFDNAFEAQKAFRRIENAIDKVLEEFGSDEEKQECEKKENKEREVKDFHEIL
jgi:hypothetical protein